MWDVIVLTPDHCLSIYVEDFDGVSAICFCDKYLSIRNIS